MWRMEEIDSITQVSSKEWREPFDYPLVTRL
jgi:hypothetical protein